MQDLKVVNKRKRNGIEVDTKSIHKIYISFLNRYQIGMFVEALYDRSRADLYERSRA